MAKTKPKLNIVLPKQFFTSEYIDLKILYRNLIIQHLGQSPDHEKNVFF